MQYYREYAKTVNNRNGNMIKNSGIATLISRSSPGFASVYQFAEADAKAIRASGESKGLGKYSVASDTLIIDIDDGDAGLFCARAILDRAGLSYEVWFSGNKGYHIYIAHDFIESPALPYSHLKYIERLGIECDKTLYQHGRLFRLPGSVHEKSGKKKEFLFKVEGVQPVITLETPPPRPNFASLSANDELLAIGLMRAAGLATNEPAPGNRHSKLWGTAKDLLEAGLAYDTVLDIMLRINESWENPKDESEVELAVKQAYQQAER